MPRVRIIALSAGPEGVRHPGAVHDVTDDEARALVAARAAEWVTPPRENAMTAPRENAALATRPPVPRGRR